MLSTESTWLQKALFALQKAESAQEKWADLHEEEEANFVLPYDGGELDVDTIREAIENRISDLLSEVKERRRVIR
ncbi:MAG: hypothetical protein P8188_17660 [Gemmatimonadota bacterium]